MANFNWFTRPIGMMGKYGFKNLLHTSCMTKLAWLPFARSPKVNNERSCAKFHSVKF